MRLLILALLISQSGTSWTQNPAPAPQPWANKLFGAAANLHHNFGVVKQGNQLQHAFEVTNIYKVPIEIFSVRSQYSTAKATAEKKTLKPNEKTKIVVTVDTGRFLGYRGGTIFVIFGPEYISEAILTWEAVSK